MRLYVGSKLPFLRQDWKRTSGQFDRPAPLPEGPVDVDLAKLLVPAPHVVPEKKAKEKAMGTRKSSRCPVSSDLPDDPNAPSASEDEEEEEEEEASPTPTGGGKKRKAAPTGEAGGSKKGKILLPYYAPDAEDGGREWPSRVKPLAKS